MRKLFALSILLLASCDDDEYEDKFERTPDGFKVRWAPSAPGTLSTGLSTKAVLYAEFDDAVRRAEQELLRDHGTDPGVTRTRAYQTLFTIHDRIWFWCGGSRATGCFWPRQQVEIEVAYWPTLTDPDPANIPPDAPSWTVYYGTDSGNWYWGVHDTTRIYPSLGWELGRWFGYKPGLRPRVQMVEFIN